jgi:hypothetical protein
LFLGALVVTEMAEHHGRRAGFRSRVHSFLGRSTEIGNNQCLGMLRKAVWVELWTFAGYRPSRAWIVPQLAKIFGAANLVFLVWWIFLGGWRG